MLGTFRNDEQIGKKKEMSLELPPGKAQCIGAGCIETDLCLMERLLIR
jgi:hypothetical protein